MRNGDPNAGQRLVDLTVVNDVREEPMKPIWRVSAYLKRYPFLALGMLVCAIAGTLVVIVFPVVTKEVLDVVKMDVTRILMNVRIQSEEEVREAALAIEERAEHIGNVTYTHPNDDGSRLPNIRQA